MVSLRTIFVVDYIIGSLQILIMAENAKYIGKNLKKSVYIMIMLIVAMNHKVIKEQVSFTNRLEYRISLLQVCELYSHMHPKVSSINVNVNCSEMRLLVSVLLRRNFEVIF